MQYNLTFEIETEADQPRITVREFGEQCELCTEVSAEHALLRISTLITRWCDEVARLNG